MFQFTRPRGARLMVQDLIPGDSWFQFTRPRGARLRVFGFRRVPDHCFNSRAREGRDWTFLHKRQATRVSIHAPARGATVPSLPRCEPVMFQFTRPRGARLRRGKSLCPKSFRFNSRAREGRDNCRAVHCHESPGFNSRAREGRDPCLPLLNGIFRVSIHAPARGAT